MVCGNYEGIDERVVELEIEREISIGDYVLTGGELGALVLINAVARHVEGVLGNADSAVRAGRYLAPPRAKNATKRWASRSMKSRSSAERARNAWVTISE